MRTLADLDGLLRDSSIEELWLNDCSAVYVARNGVSERLAASFSPRDISLWVERLLVHSQRRLDKSQPFVDATLSDGSRLHVVIPDITSGMYAINIRKFMRRIDSLSELVNRKVMDTATAVFLEACAINGYNIVVAGGTGTGKTTLLNCILASIPMTERIVTCEEVFELQVPQPDHVGMQTRLESLEGSGCIPLRELVRQSLRMRPQRLVVGEVRAEESLDMLLALNSGQPGLATIHANSAAEAVLKLCTLPLLAGENVTTHFVVPTVAAAIDVIVHVQRDAQGHRRISEVRSVTGRLVEGQPEHQQLIAWNGVTWVHNHVSRPLNKGRSDRVDAWQVWQAVA